MAARTHAQSNLLLTRGNKGEICRAGRLITGAQLVRETGRIPRILQDKYTLD